MAKRNPEITFRFIVAAVLAIAGLVACGAGLMTEGTPALVMVGIGAMLLIAGAIVAEPQP